jgi:hypothetical protein
MSLVAVMSGVLLSIGVTSNPGPGGASKEPMGWSAPQVAGHSAMKNSSRFGKLDACAMMFDACPLVAVSSRSRWVGKGARFMVSEDFAWTIKQDQLHKILPLQSYLSTIPQFNQPDDLKVVTNPADNYDPEHTASRFSWSGECAWESSHPVHH